MTKRILAAAAALSAAILTATSAALAGGPQPQTITCESLGKIQIVTGPAVGTQTKNVQVWGAARIVGGGILIPTSFTFTAYDDTIGQLLFTGSVPKGSGNGNQNQPTTSCSQSQTGKLGDFWDPDDPLPDGAALTDTATITLSVTAVVKP